MRRNTLRMVSMTAALCTWLTAPATAQQAFSKSMVECSVIADTFADLGEEMGTDPKNIRRFREDALAFSNAAGPQAHAEGQTDVPGYLTAIRLELETKWSRRITSVFKMKENGDWLDYCRKFGRAQGILTR